MKVFNYPAKFCGMIAVAALLPTVPTTHAAGEIRAAEVSAIVGAAHPRGARKQNQNKGIPWTLIPGLVGFGIGIVVQFRLRKHIDPDKMMRCENLANFKRGGMPPREILTERGLKLYPWFLVGAGLFALSIIVTGILYGEAK